jgi:hypothetical protein
VDDEFDRNPVLVLPQVQVCNLDLPWTKSRIRTIDDQTLIDLLQLIEYQADRVAMTNDRADVSLGLASWLDMTDPVDALFGYVLDALGVPAEGAEKHFTGERSSFSRVCRFSRDWFSERFFADYLLGDVDQEMTVKDVLDDFRREVSLNLDRHFK